jgi:hypothetical protein
MVDDIPAYLNCRNGFVQMLTSDVFYQITNCESDIAFGSNLLVQLINQCQEVLHEIIINENFFYTEFTDINGTKQIAYKFGNLGIDFGQELLFLKLKHTTSDSVWYSAGFLITNDLQEETTFFEYKNESYFKGISYDVLNTFQVVRLQCFKTDLEINDEKEEITQLSGMVISSRVVEVTADKYLFYLCDFFTFKRLRTLLNHEIIYIDGYRISNKPTPTKGERTEDTNTFDVTFNTNTTQEFKPITHQIS